MNDLLKVTQFTGAEWIRTQTWLTPHRPSLEQSLGNTYPMFLKGRRYVENQAGQELPSSCTPALFTWRSTR